jgi:hypothetical protein
MDDIESLQLKYRLRVGIIVQESAVIFEHPKIIESLNLPDSSKRRCC